MVLKEKCIYRLFPHKYISFLFYISYWEKKTDLHNAVISAIFKYLHFSDNIGKKDNERGSNLYGRLESSSNAQHMNDTGHNISKTNLQLIK